MYFSQETDGRFTPAFPDHNSDDMAAANAMMELALTDHSLTASVT